MIPVTKPYLPNIKKYKKYIENIYKKNWLTNNGPLVNELKNRLEDYLGVNNLLLVSNGTMALEVAYHALDLKNEVITSPFSFVATTSSLEWSGITPCFADINSKTFNMDPENSNILINKKTTAIVPVHVFGNPCEVERFDKISREKNIKVIYDAAHSFGVSYKKSSLLKWGNASVLSFHATKVFHTVEGGAIVFKEVDDYEKACEIINFGINKNQIVNRTGINAKMSEFHAAMGLSMIDDMDDVFKNRKESWETYIDFLGNSFKLQHRNCLSTNNYSYMPILIPENIDIIQLMEKLMSHGIFTRRYFHPSLDLIYTHSANSKNIVSHEISSHILCLPLYYGIKKSEIRKICDLLLMCLDQNSTM